MPIPHGWQSNIFSYRVLPEISSQDEVLALMTAKRQLTTTKFYMSISAVQGGLVYCVAAFICPGIAVLVIAIVKICSQIGTG